MYFKSAKFSIDKEQMAMIDNLFSQYDEAKLGRIAPKDARLILRSLGLSSEEGQKIVVKADVEKRSMIKYENLIETLRLHLGEAQARLEMNQIFEAIRVIGGQPERAKLEFMRTGKKSAPTINHEEISKTAAILKEALTEDDIKEMMDFAAFGSDATDKHPGQLTLDKFITLLQKTSIW